MRYRGEDFANPIRPRDRCDLSGASCNIRGKGEASRAVVEFDALQELVEPTLLAEVVRVALGDGAVQVAPRRREPAAPEGLES